MRRPPYPHWQHPVAQACFLGMLAASLPLAHAALPPPVYASASGAAKPQAAESSRPGQPKKINLQQAYPVYPRVEINGQTITEPVGFFAQVDTLYVNHAGLLALGLQLQEEECPDLSGPSPISGLPNGYFALNSCTIVQAEYSSSRQQLKIRAPLDKLNLPTVQLGQQGEGTQPSMTRPNYSALVNYDVAVLGGSDSKTQKNLFTQFRFGTPYGFFESNHLQADNDGRRKHRRLDTFWRSVWPEQGLTLTLGDTYTSQLTGGSGSRMGGIQLSSSFNTRPWYQKLPQTVFTGSNEMPSSVDLYLNGVRQYREDVNAGPYEINLPPTITAGAAQVVTRDALGREVVVEVPLYDTTEMLAPGLQEWSVEAGQLRLDEGAKKSYDSDTLVSASLRRGLHQQLTGQAHAEAKKSYQQYGLGLRAAFQFPTQIGVEASSSKLHGASGHRYSLFAVQQGQRWSLSAGGNRTSAQFATLADTLVNGNTFVGSAHDRKQAYLNGNLSLKDWGSLSLGRIWSREGAERQDVWTLGWTHSPTQRVTLMANLSYDERNKDSRSAMVGISVALDHNITSSSYVSRHGDRNGWSTALYKGAQAVGDLGWNLGLSGEEGESTSGHAGMHYISQYGDADLQLRRRKDDSNTWQASWAGGLVLMDSTAAATRTMHDSFAVVSTNGISGVPVTVQNTYVGRSNQDGKIFVPNLMAYQNNVVAIDSTQLDANQIVSQSRQVVVPYEKQGNSVAFAVRTVQAWQVTLRQAQEADVVPMGASVLSAQGLPLAVVGHGGMVYMETPQGSQGDASGGTFRVLSHDRNGQAQECIFSVDLSRATTHAHTFVHDFGVVTCE